MDQKYLLGNNNDICCKEKAPVLWTQVIFHQCPCLILSGMTEIFNNFYFVREINLIFYFSYQDPGNNRNFPLCKAFSHFSPHPKAVVLNVECLLYK